MNCSKKINPNSMTVRILVNTKMLQQPQIVFCDNIMIFYIISDSNWKRFIMILMNFGFVLMSWRFGVFFTTDIITLPWTHALQFSRPWISWHRYTIRLDNAKKVKSNSTVLYCIIMHHSKKNSVHCEFAYLQTIA